LAQAEDHDDREETARTMFFAIIVSVALFVIVPWP
jgi:hypothetical protein